MGDLRGKTVLVTGASSGIGAATARAFAAAGGRVALLARRRDRLEALAGALRREGAGATVCVADVTDAAAVTACVQRVLAEWGGIDVLVNNAGRGLAAPFDAITAQELRDILEVNLVAVLTATQAVLPLMRRQGSGHIVNVSSIAGRRASPLIAAYNATKFGLVGLSESLRQELRGTGIHLSIVYPVNTETEFREVEPRKVARGLYGPVQAAEVVARAIVRCARRPRPEVYPYPPARLLAALSALTPRIADWLMDAAMRRAGR
jgi:short-subunit dehydrogenase